MISMQFEPWSAVEQELRVLCHMHWKEIAGQQDRIPLDPDWATYGTLDAAGKMRFLAVRDDDTLIGYMIVFIWGHLHYRSTLHAAEDIYYLHPAYRRGTLGFKMFRVMLSELKRLGVVKAQFTHKRWFESGRVASLLQRLGGVHTEDVYVFMLQE